MTTIEMRKNQYNAVLRTYFGYEALKKEQLDIIDKIIYEKKDVCAILATGFGKSICYQLPFLLTKKCVIIISPLLSLMEDQRQKLEKIKIPVCCFNSNNKNKINDINDIYDGNYKIIFMTPEY